VDPRGRRRGAGKAGLPASRPRYAGRGRPADAIATLLGAVGDGLLLHALLDPDLDVHAALNALRALLAPRPS
jgi:hypothetical protein